MTSTPTDLDDTLRSILAADIFTGMGLDALSDADRHELLATMLVTIKDRVLARVLDELSTTERTELTRLVSTSPAAAVSEWLAEHVPSLDALMTQEALTYKAEMVQNAAHIRQLLGEHPEGELGQLHPPGGNADTSLPAVVPDDLPVPYTPPGLPATQDEAPPAVTPQW